MQLLTLLWATIFDRKDDYIYIHFWVVVNVNHDGLLLWISIICWLKLSLYLHQFSYWFENSMFNGTLYIEDIWFVNVYVFE